MMGSDTTAHTHWALYKKVRQSTDKVGFKNVARLLPETGDVLENAQKLACWANDIIIWKKNIYKICRKTIPIEL